jgi:hypothetical protein
MQVNNAVDYYEFSQFINKGTATEMTIEDFKTNVIERFCNNSEGGLNFRGFVDYFNDFVTVNGEEAGFNLIRQ